MKQHFKDFKFRLLTTNDGAKLLELINRNRQRLVDYFPVTSSAITNLDSSFKYVDQYLGMEARKEQFILVLEDKDNLLQGMILIKNIDWRVPKAELAYFIDKSLQGKGIMTRALEATVRYGFEELGMNRLFIITSVDNHSSRKIAEKNGFEAEGLLRKNFRISSGELIDNVYYGKLK